MMKKFKNSFLVGAVALAGLMASGISSFAASPLYLRVSNNNIEDKRSVKSPSLAEIKPLFGVMIGNTAGTPGESKGDSIKFGDFKENTNYTITYMKEAIPGTVVSSNEFKENPDIKIVTEAGASIEIPKNGTPKIKLDNFRFYAQKSVNPAHTDEVLGYVLQPFFTLVD